MEKIKNNKIKLEKLPLPLSFFAIFLFIFIMNVFTPILADDYYYSFIAGSLERVQGIGDIFKSLSYLYMHHTGRSIIFLVTQTFLMFKPFIFDFFCSLAFVGLVFLIFRISNFAQPKKPAILVGFAAMLIWFFTPAFGQTFLWVTGAVNYVFVLTLILAFLYPYFKYFIDPQNDLLKFKGSFVLWFFVGVMAGWGFENFSAMAVAMTVIFVIFYIIFKQKVPLWAITGGVGSLVGFALLMLAPGNYARADVYESANGIIQIIYRFMTYTLNIFSELKWLILIFIVAFVFAAFSKCNLKQKMMPVLAFFAAALCHGAMIASPIYPKRAMFGTAIFLVLGIIMSLSILANTAKIDKRIVVSISVCMVFLFSISYTNALLDVCSAYSVSKSRNEYIQTEKAKGNYDLVVPVIKPKTSYNALKDDGLTDVNIDAEKNTLFAKYYGLNSVKGEK